jgi:hypothetical protein
MARSIVQGALSASCLSAVVIWIVDSSHTAMPACHMSECCAGTGCVCRWILTDQLTLNDMWRENGKVLVTSVDPEQVRQGPGPGACLGACTGSGGQYCSHTQQERMRFAGQHLHCLRLLACADQPNRCGCMVPC